MGIESDGGIKGCPSLQSVPFDHGLFEILEEPFDAPDVEQETTKTKIQKVKV